ncbi:hypothetical protein [Bradyrhizobium quebecense]|uniref:Uncharacterized protein n=1 Tax=Bradyrhizobium quebecense TaxID=2748629 RepID=A0ACD3V4W5_9BRAD|nr:hypothetical protein [Bradyrhizobium quebecense]UGY01388.1 hypothetical protein J4P68_0030365 [Bradyrhizobium quebecense]
MTQVKKNIVTTILIVVGCVVVASGYELTRKYINTRIDRMLAQKLPAMVPPSPQKTAVVEEQPAGNAQLIASIGALDARIKALESLSLATNFGSNSDRPPLVSDYRGVGAPVFALFDRVGPYRKNGLFEIYGASLRERRTGAIRVSEADLEITHDEAWVIWSPDYSPARDATHLEVDFAAVPTAGKLTIGFIGKDGQASAYTINLGPPTLAPTGLLPPLLPADIVARANAANSIGEPHPSANNVIAPLPANLMLQLRNGQPDQIQQWFVKINGAAGTTVRFKRLALIRPMPAATTIGVTLSGRVSGADIPRERRSNCLTIPAG